MKKLIMFLLPVFMIGFFSSCGDDTETTTDDLLIQEIADTESRTAIAESELPETAQQFVDENYFDTYIEVATRAEGKGYELLMGSSELQYFNLEGRPLVAERAGRRHRPGHGPGGCNPEPIAIEDLPEAITTYIAENYPDAEILGARARGEVIIVKLDGHILLVFGEDGSFIEAAEVMPHHGHGQPIALENLSTVITDYIAANYADAEIKKAFQGREDHIVVGLLVNGERVIVIFDADGNFVGER